jgi:sterol 3beta-glucosyltransferase
VGWGGLSSIDLPDNILLITSNEAPHDWLLPQVAGAIHHGGAGTTAAMFRAGIPSLIVPAYSDHFFWGQRIADLAVGLPLLSEKQLTAERLAQAIQTLAHDRTLQAKAAAIGERIRAEPGISTAIAVIQQHLSPRSISSKQLQPI